MTLTIPDPIAEQAGLDEPTALKELALTLFAQRRLSASQARRIAGVSFFEFEAWLKERDLASHELTDDAFSIDLANLQRA